MKEKLLERQKIHKKILEEKLTNFAEFFKTNLSVFSFWVIVPATKMFWLQY